MSSIYTLMDGQKKDDALHSPIIASAKPAGTPVEENTVSRFKSLGLTQEEIQSLLKR